MRVSIIPQVAAIVSLSITPALAAPKPLVHGGPKSTARGSTQTTHGGHKGTTGTTHGSSHKPITAKPTTTTTPLLNPIAHKVSSNHGLMPKVTALLPAGMTLDQASLGFKNQGQFVAALHVSRNLGIPFADLKAAMTGITPILGPVPPGTTVTATTPLLSLGQAIQKLRPSANSTTEATTAEHQATSDLSETTARNATSTSPKKKG